MTHTKRLLISLLAIAACGNALQAQDATTPRHEVSASLQGLGLGSTPFKGTMSWNDQPGLTLGFNLGYTYWFNTHFGVRTGVRLTLLSHNQEISNFNMPFSTTLPLSSLGIIGGSGMTTVNMRATATSVQEEQQYTFIEVPVLLAMRFQQLYVNFGISLTKAVSATADYSYTDPTCAVTEIPSLGITPATPVPMTLVGETEGSVKNRNMAKPFYVPIAAEVGYNIPVGEATNINVGLFGRYAPISYKTSNAVEAYAINPDATYRTVQPSTSTMAERKGYYEVGLTLGVNFGITKHKHATDESNQSALTSVNTTANPYNAELEAMKADRERTQKELEAIKADRENAQKELAAMKAARENAEKELDAMKAARIKAEKDMTTRQATPAKANTTTEKPAANAYPKDNSLRARVEALVVNFNFKSTTPNLDDADRATLSELATAMKEDNNLKVVVTGYTDNSGSRKVNNKYGIRRAYSVKRHLVKEGAPAANIKCASKGETDPIANNDTKEGRAMNRRATVMFE